MAPAEKETKEQKISELRLELVLKCREEDERLICSGELPRIIKEQGKYLYVAVSPEIEYQELDPDVAEYVSELEQENARLREENTRLRAELEELKRKLAEIEARLSGKKS